HAGQELQVRIIDVHHAIVINHVLVGDRSVADLAYLAMKSAIRVSINCEVDVLADGDAADIRFGNQGIDLDLAEASGYYGQVRCVKAGRDGLPNIHIPGDDHAIDRGE